MADSDRVAELKRKMQESAQKAKAEAAAKEGDAPAAAVAAAAPDTPAKPTAAAVTPANPAQAAESVPPLAAPVAVSAAVAEAAGIDPNASSAGVVSQGAAVAALPEQSAPAASRAAAADRAAATNGAPLIPPDPATFVEPQLSPEELAKRTMGRREFLTYAWGGSLGLVGLATGVGLFQFMYPRFRAGEFGGKFFLGAPDTMPATDAAPVADPAGKFWLVNTTDEGVKAIYMVCTHLGCLYKWEPSTVRFECPCHGSKFTREGFYIEGPAPRSLDRFTVSEEEGQVVVDTGSRITGAPSGDSPARAA